MNKAWTMSWKSPTSFKSHEQIGYESRTRTPEEMGNNFLNKAWTSHEAWTSLKQVMNKLMNKFLTSHLHVTTHEKFMTKSWKISEKSWTSCQQGMNNLWTSNEVVNVKQMWQIFEQVLNISWTSWEKI